MAPECMSAKQLLAVSQEEGNMLYRGFRGLYSLTRIIFPYSLLRTSKCKWIGVVLKGRSPSHKGRYRMGIRRLCVE